MKILAFILIKLMFSICLQIIAVINIYIETCTHYVTKEVYFFYLW